MELRKESAEAVAVTVDAVSATTAGFMRHRAESALEETMVILQEFETANETSWFEDFGVGARAKQRRSNRSFAHCLRKCQRHASCAHYAASRLLPSDELLLERGLPSLGHVCAAAREVILHAQREPSAPLEPLSLLEECRRVFSVEFETRRDALSPEACAFLHAVAGVVEDTTCAIKNHADSIDGARVTTLTNLPAPPRLKFCARLRRHARTVATHFGVQWIDPQVTHPRFVLRNTISITIAFFVGWVGMASINVMDAYSYVPSCTITVIVYTYAGASMPITIRRVAGVVLGRVLGSLIQLAFAVEVWYGAACFALSMWLVIAFLFFLYLSGSAENGNVCCLAVSYAAVSMIPSGGRFRTSDASTATTNLVRNNLLNIIIQTIVGILIMSAVDSLLSSRASRQAGYRLFRALRRSAKCVLTSFPEDSDVPNDDTVANHIGLLEDLDSLRDLLPHASAEPSYWRRPFKADLYEALERHLRVVEERAATIEWAIQPDDVDIGTTSSAQRRLLGSVHGEVQSMLRNLMELSHSVVPHHDVSESAPPPEVREQIEANLYMLRAAKHVAKITKAALGTASTTVRAQLHASAPEASIDSISTWDSDVINNRNASGTNRSSRVRQRIALAAKQLQLEVLPDDLEDEGWVESTGARSPQITPSLDELAHDSFEELYAKLRAAATQHPTAWPLTDGRCRTELLITMIKSLLGEIRKMQWRLLEY
eukprot:NODE_1972_length_2322_cov_2.811845.p1 GENE.NODE_1972_length_2322_cov_2.811845~~NODE_1972_length_2322_cov_2.811845.p1  ORF type:complete len:729 (-),score=199.89 NODE_1972_length_2322_cov_2.811845:134-2278(-)